MAITQLTDDLDIIQALSNLPNDTDGLTASALKAKFDEAAGLIKVYLNDTLIAELESTTDGSSGGDKIGITTITDLTGNDVQTVLEALKTFVDTYNSNNDTDISTLQSDKADKSSTYLTSELYTQTELNAGQLDNQYYTETELDAGQLDNRYYTETESDNSLGLKADKTNVLEKDNTTSFTPSANYHPATKKYIDDVAADFILGDIPDDSLTNAKLGTDIKIGSLASLITANKTSVVNAINELKRLQSCKVYGLEWDQSTDTYKRLGDAYGLTGGTDFDDNTIFGSIKRCNLSDAGVVNDYYGDTSYAEDGTNGQIMVEIPRFWYRVEKSGTIFRWYVSDTEIDGFTLHPAFSRNSVTKDHIYLGAYEGSIYDTSAVAHLLDDEQVGDFTATTGDVLSSIADAKPASGLTQSLTLPNSRILAQNRGTGWEQQDFLISSAIQMLFAVEYGTLNTQSIFTGVTNITDGGSSNMAVKTGYTSNLGNASGEVSNTHYSTSETCYPFSYRGIENLYGNIWKWVDGLNIQADNKPYIADNSFASDKFTDNYTYLGITLPNTNGYVSNIQYTSTFDYGFLPSAVAGSSTTYLADYYYQATGNRVARLGGFWNDGAGGGGFCWRLSDSSGSRFRSIAARLAYVG